MTPERWRQIEQLCELEPYDVSGRQHEAVQAILEEDPNPLSTIARPIVSLDAPPDGGWLPFEAQEFLGGSLAAQRRFEEAERELLNAYDGLVVLGSRIPAQEKPAIAQTVERLVALYRAWGNEDRARVLDQPSARG